MAARKKSAARKSASKKSASGKSASKKKSARSSSAGADALTLLRTDHKNVQGMFDQFEKTRSSDRKQALAEQICNELTVHAQIEEEIFYPAARGAIREKDLIAEATVEHQSAKDLIAQIEGARSKDEMWEAKVKVLGEYIKHHVKEEQNELFPQVRKTKLDTKALGEQMEARKMELMGEAGGSRGGARGKRSSGGGSGGSSRGAEEEPSGEGGLMARMARGIGLSSGT
jgi:hemerythrin superfamily protein